MKLTKAQREFFAPFTRDAVLNLLVSQINPQHMDTVLPVATEVLDSTDLSQLSQAVGEGFMEVIDFKTLKSVDKFMKSEQYQKAVEASAVVIAGLHEQIGSVIEGVAAAVEASLSKTEE